MLSAQSIAYAYERTSVLNGVDLDVAQGEILCLLGASGSGKTTLLRVLAGLEAGYSGHVYLNDQRIDRTPAHRRGFGLMFQDFALFPHMTVAENIAFGLKMQGQPRKAQRKVVGAMLDLVGLLGFEERYVDQLSGGERQRVALARSLAPEPRLLMLDEPLGSLDAALRNHLVVEVREIIKRIHLTTLYVTHDQLEAFAIADRIAIMYQGRIEQIAAPQDLYWQPQTAYVARFLGLNNLLPVLHYANGQAETALGVFGLDAPADVVLLHPDGITLSDPQSATIVGTIQACVFQGDHYRLDVQTDADIPLRFRVRSRGGVAAQGAEVGLRAEHVVGLVDAL